MKTWGWVLPRALCGCGQNTLPLSCTSWAVTSTIDRVELIALFFRDSDQGQPVGVLRVAAAHDVEEGRLDLLGDGAPRTAAQLDAVQLADRRHLGGGAGEEGLVADVHLVARDALFHHPHPHVLPHV